LDIDGEAVEGTLNGIFGGGVHHAWVLRRIIRAPGDESYLVSGAFAALKLVLHIEDGVAASDAFLAFPVLGLCVEQLLAEIRPSSVLAGLSTTISFQSSLIL